MLSLVLALQLVATSTPPGGDTTGYWQQRIRYHVEATLDEPTNTLHAAARLAYVNNSPDALDRLYFHQYLNAFRPGSKWSEADVREGRVRFQNLKDPDYAYERFTAPVRVRRFGEADWADVTPQYPNAPDSTVVYFLLPRPLVAGDSLEVELRWDARVSTVFRRQGRLGRHYDFAQWYPKVAVYDRGGWQHNPLTPAGEFYGEYGTYDVALTVRDDQVIGATGVPVAGDPGWARVRRWGVVATAATPTSLTDLAAYTDSAPSGFKTVRWVADNVHHFGFSVDPAYMYEGATYTRKRKGADPSDAASAVRNRVPSFDTVAIHVLYRPGDEREWGNGIVVGRVITALEWLESLYGNYAYPQLTSLHRLDRGGTEFPMMMMNGSASLGLNLHEGGHMYSYAILGNNEWRSAWMDEGLSDHQTRWAQGLTAHERAKNVMPAAKPIEGYRRHAPVPSTFDADQIDQYRLQLTRRAKPIATPSTEYHDFLVYQDMVYGRAENMYSALRDVMGDSAFVRFLRGYYSRWALRHVDELAMRTEAERAYGKSLDWFFDQWLHRTGLLDYSLEDVRVQASGTEFVTSANVVKRGDYLHPMTLGVRTSNGWTTVRGDVRARQRLSIRTTEKPLDVRLDPFRVTDDWDRRNDVQHHGFLSSQASRVTFAWPFLDQVDRERQVITLRPEAWISDRDLTLGIRARSSYQGWIDKWDAGLAARGGPEYKRASDGTQRFSLPSSPAGRVQTWFVAENLRTGNRDPVVGARAGVWLLDGLLKADLRKRIDDSELVSGRGRNGHRTFALTGTLVTDDSLIAHDRWTKDAVVDASVEYETQRRPDALTFRLLLNTGGGWTSGSASPNDVEYFARIELEARRKTVTGADSNVMTTARALFAFSDAPLERSTMLASANPTETFENHYVRPRDGLLAPRRTSLAPHWSYLIPGGAYLRGYDPGISLGHIVAANVERSLRLVGFGGVTRRVHLWASVFADVGAPLVHETVLGDAGVGFALRGRMFDRNVTVRADFPVYVRSLTDYHGRDLDFRLRLSARDLF